ncbi:MAG: acetylxylan esterase [Acidobacteria bacterium]|nr:acetylxylan esterase [Acidobacteriota bacterium]
MSSITRRTAVALFGAGALSPGIRAQQQVLYRDYAKCLPDFLRHLVGESVRKRNEAVGALTTPAAIRARQQWVREMFWKLSGGEPQRTPLHVRTIGAFERSAYRMEKLVYETQPEFHVPANLYIPKAGKPPYPGVLFQMGHSLNGKAAAPYQKCCQGLVQLGFVVLAFDPMGQGERVYYPREDLSRTRLSSSDAEHTTPGQQMLLVGMTSTRLQAWDAMRSLDVLASHPLVDAKRLASTGNSGGGTLTMFLSACDDRLAVAAPSCPNSENFACEDFIPPGSTDDAEQNFIGAGPLGFDRWDLLYPLAPKPLLVLISAKDFFGTYSPSYVKNGRQEFATLAGVYKRLGAEEKVRWWESPLPHGLNHGARMEIYRWFRRWLQSDTAPLSAEPPVTPEPDAQLLVTEKGNTVRSFGGATPLSLARERMRTVKPTPVGLRELLGIEELYERPRRVKLGEVEAEGCRVQAIEVATATHTWAPCWLYSPRSQRRGGMLLVIDSAGRNSRAGEDALWQQLAASGVSLCAADVRAVGDLMPEAGRGALRYTMPHASEHDYAWASIMLGQSMVGQRAADIISIVRALQPERVTVAASGKLTVPAMFAAALEPRIEKLYLSGGLASYKHLLDVEEYTHPFASFVPGVLLHTDLPAIGARLGKRLIVAGAVDGRGRALPLGEARGLYATAEVLERAEWSVERLRDVLVKV